MILFVHWFHERRHPTDHCKYGPHDAFLFVGRNIRDSRIGLVVSLDKGLVNALSTEFAVIYEIQSRDNGK